MANSSWTPAREAQFDQDMAAASELLKKHVGQLRDQIAKFGERQGVANFCLYLTEFGDIDLYLNLLIPALRELALLPENPAG